VCACTGTRQELVLSPGTGASGISAGNAAAHLVVTAAVQAAAIVASGSSPGGRRRGRPRVRRSTASTAVALVHSALWLGLLAAQLGSVKAYECFSDDQCKYEGCDDKPCSTSDSNCVNGFWRAFCVRNPNPCGGACTPSPYHRLRGGVSGEGREMDGGGW